MNLLNEYCFLEIIKYLNQRDTYNFSKLNILYSEFYFNNIKNITYDEYISKDLKYFKELNLSFNKDFTIDLSNLNNIKKLDISNNKNINITNLPTSLIELNCSNCDLQDTKFLSNLNNIKIFK